MIHSSESSLDTQLSLVDQEMEGNLSLIVAVVMAAKFTSETAGAFVKRTVPH